jgi:hypothetical protein
MKAIFLKVKSQGLRLLVVFSFIFVGCNIAIAQLNFTSNNTKLNNAFDWAKNKALSFAHDGSDPVGYWYEAALPNREAFCMRDVSHQAIGASILGLKAHNLNMFQKFATNISVEKDYCSYWEINRYNKPAPVDYENDKDFWYNLPANFDVVYNAWRLYQWTGDKAYIEDPAFKKFYALSMKEYVDHWQLDYDKIRQRNRSMHSARSKRFETQRGIPTYNEGGRDETKIAIDLTSGLIAAYKSYANILKLNGRLSESKTILHKVKKEQQFLNDFWYDKKRKEFKSVQYIDQSFDYFMVGDDQAFLHYILYFDAIDDQKKIAYLAKQYAQNYDKLIVELKSYIPIVFYENGYSSLATKMIIDLCAPVNKRRDYPENSFTIMEHITRGLMGVEPDAVSNVIMTLPRLDIESDFAEITELPILANTIAVKHNGNISTEFKNITGSSITWKACIPGRHAYLYLNNVKKKCQVANHRGKFYSYISTIVKQGQQSTISINN